MFLDPEWVNLDGFAVLGSTPVSNSSTGKPDLKVYLPTTDKMVLCASFKSHTDTTVVMDIQYYTVNIKSNVKIIHSAKPWADFFSFMPSVVLSLGCQWGQNPFL